MLGSFDRCKHMNAWMNVRMNIWRMLMLRMNICECMNECKNEYMGNDNVKNEYIGNVNVRSECGIGGMLGVNVEIGEC